jgi:hypothetical protein
MSERSRSYTVDACVEMRPFPAAGSRVLGMIYQIFVNFDLLTNYSTLIDIFDNVGMRKQRGFAAARRRKIGRQLAHSIETDYLPQ